MDKKPPPVHDAADRRQEAGEYLYGFSMKSFRSSPGRNPGFAASLVLRLKFFLVLFLLIMGMLVQPYSMSCSFKHFQRSATSVDTVSSS